LGKNSFINPASTFQRIGPQIQHLFKLLVDALATGKFLGSLQHNRCTFMSQIALGL